MGYGNHILETQQAVKSETFGRAGDCDAQTERIPTTYKSTEREFQPHIKAWRENTNHTQRHGERIQTTHKSMKTIPITHRGTKREFKPHLKAWRDISNHIQMHRERIQTTLKSTEREYQPHTEAQRENSNHT